MASQKDVLDSLLNPESRDDQEARDREQRKGGVTKKGGHREEKTIDREMLQDLKKMLPTTESQNLRDIDAITKPSTRSQQRKQQQQFLADVSASRLEPHESRKRAESFESEVSIFANSRSL